MKKVLLMAVLAGVIMSCEKAIPVVDPTAMDNRNIYIRMYKYFKGDILNKNNVYAINGDMVRIDHMYLTLSGAEFVSYDEADTIRTESDLTVVDLVGTTEVKLAHLPKGSYNGRMYYTIGLDSARSYMKPENLEETNPLSKGTVWNGSDIGHSYFQLEGSIFDPADTVFTTPKSTFTWRFATPALGVRKNEKRNFSVASNKDVFFVINLDVDKLFLGLTPSAVPVINSDPADGSDFTNAQILRNNVVSELVFEL
jgi:hypothetical protein